MKTFTWNTLTFILVLILFLLIINISLSTYLNNSSLFKTNSLNESIESKISKLYVENDSINIIIAGDSRGERGLIPNTFKSKIGINTINIAVSAGDLAETLPAIDRLNSSNIFIISASSWQINDGACDVGFLSLKCFQEMTLIEQLYIYRKDLSKILLMKKQVLIQVFKALGKRQDWYSYDSRIINEKGFWGFEDTLAIDPVYIDSLITKHTWYKNINSRGVRWRIFAENFEKLGNTNSLIFVYQPPVSPAWKEKTENTFIGQFENVYSESVDSLCRKYNNILFYDFYSNDIVSLDNSAYYDYQHLNRKGAEVFSEIFAEMIFNEIELRKRNTQQ